MRFRVPEKGGACSDIRHGPPDGSESKVPGDYYTLRLDGGRDLCVLPLSHWKRQTYALRNPDAVLSSLVPSCIRYLGLDLETLFNDQLRRKLDPWFGILESCGCGFDYYVEYSFPDPIELYDKKVYEDEYIPPYCQLAVVCPREPWVPFLKGLKHVKTVVLVGVCDRLLALSGPVTVDGVPFSRRVRGISSWKEADDTGAPDTPEKCTRAFDGTDSYAFIPLRPEGDEEEAPPLALDGISAWWRSFFLYEDYLPELKFRVVSREKTFTSSGFVAFFQRTPRYPVEWAHGGLEHHYLSDDEKEIPTSVADGGGQDGGHKTADKGTSCHVPCIFGLEEGVVVSEETCGR